MYCVVNALATPTIRPPTTAPTGLSKPPSAAAANAYTRMACIEAAVSAVVVGITIEPATAPSAAVDGEHVPALVVGRLHVTPVARQVVGADRAILQIDTPAKSLHLMQEPFVSVRVDVYCIEGTWHRHAVRGEKHHGAGGRKRAGGGQIKHSAGLLRTQTSPFLVSA